MINEDTRNKIISIRILSGKSRSDFAEWLGIPYRTLQEWELGKRQPPEYVLNLIAEKVSCTNEKLLNAKCCINDFSISEYGEIADFTNLTKIPIAYSTYGNSEEYEINIEADLINMSMKLFINSVMVKEEKYSSLDLMIDSELKYLSFDSLVCPVNWGIEDDEIDTLISLNKKNIAQNNIIKFKHKHGR